jgi:tripartite ATP-independent transporter DctM subunit
MARSVEASDMNWVAELCLFMGLLLAFLLGGMWVPFAIGAAGLVAIYLADGVIGFKALGLISWGSANSFTLTAIPLFLLMAEILQASGIGQRFYKGLALIVRGLPGGLLQTNIVGSALFAAISGSSVATAAAMATVAVPQLDANGYKPSLSAGALAAGGTLGILIPPSIPLIIYGTFTEVSVAKLFMAGMLPGLVLTLIFMAYVAVLAAFSSVRDTSHEGGRFEFRAVFDVLPVLLLIAVVIGSIYAGFATPTEAAGIGCAVAFVIAAIWGQLSLVSIHVAVKRTIATSASLLWIVFMAFIFSYAVENAGLSTMLTRAIVGLDLGKYGFLLAVVVLYCILGCLMETIAMIVLTVPLLFGAVVAYGIDPLWFGIFIVLLLELGMLTPPFGINLFVIQSVSRYPMKTIIRGVSPYWALLLFFMVLITLFPFIVTWLPGQMQN